MRVWSRKPCLELMPFVESFGFREARLGACEIYRPLPARSDCFIQFYFADRYRVVTVATGGIHRAAGAVLVGPHTRRREDLLLSGDLTAFTIQFTPVGFRAVFGIPAGEIRDFAGDAELVLGGALRRLHDRLAEDRDEASRCGAAEEFLLERLRGREVGVGMAAEASRLVLARHGAIGVARLGERYGVSVRQMERMFLEQVGVSPKMYARLARLRKALKEGAGDGRWAEVAARAGYFDQSHMVREFRALTGETPAGFRELGRRADELTRSVSRTEGDVAFVLSGRASGSLR